MMQIVCSAVFPVAEQSRAKTHEVVQLECRQHWAMLVVPACFLAAWVGMGFFFVSVLASTFGVFGQERFSEAPRVMAGMFAGSALLIGLLYWHSYRRSAVRLTNRKAVLQTGPLFQGAGEMELDRAKLLAVRQSVLGRLLNYGTVSIVGSGGERFRLRFVPNPKEFYERMNRLAST